jgi:hypothetical protein
MEIDVQTLFSAAHLAIALVTAVLTYALVKLARR